MSGMIVASRIIQWLKLEPGAEDVNKLVCFYCNYITARVERRTGSHDVTTSDPSEPDIRRILYTCMLFMLLLISNWHGLSDCNFETEHDFSILYFESKAKAK